MTNSPEEQQAHALWADYDPEHPHLFWIKYEALLVAIQQKPAVLYSKQPPVKVSPPVAPAIAHKVYHPNRQAVEKVLGDMFVMFLFYGIWFMMTRTSSWSLSLFVVWGILLAWGAKIVWGLHSFETNAQGLIIRKTLIPFKKEFLWKDLVSVQTSTKTHYARFHLTIVTRNNEQHSARYRLSKKDHEELFKQFRQKQLA